MSPCNVLPVIVTYLSVSRWCPDCYRPCRPAVCVIVVGVSCLSRSLLVFRVVERGRVVSLERLDLSLSAARVVSCCR